MSLSLSRACGQFHYHYWVGDEYRRKDVCNVCFGNWVFGLTRFDLFSH